MPPFGLLDNLFLCVPTGSGQHLMEFTVKLIELLRAVDRSVHRVSRGSSRVFNHILILSNSMY